MPVVTRAPRSRGLILALSMINSFEQGIIARQLARHGTAGAAPPLRNVFRALTLVFLTGDEAKSANQKCDSRAGREE